MNKSLVAEMPSHLDEAKFHTLIKLFNNVNCILNIY